ncbi:RDD family protein [Acinetobacter rathckeae]|uniref:RDD family protein n=1 Tax=Acinetobacter rathckeae TaxID=2605272 RepID=UPI0018A2B4D9|nr:RDD family protein [Acinetobacter rathckeae]MBF7687014.1 RDD family protein [Acinetobacter rathckeae]MBF7694582.1 RDD family protein [Acinetobacter rathckeae]
MQIYLARNGQQAGPYSLEQINQMLQDQQILLTDLAWHQGMTEWKALGELTRGQLQYYPEGYTHNTPQPNEAHPQKVTPVELASIQSRILAKMIDMLLWFIALIIFSLSLNTEHVKQLEAFKNSVNQPTLSEFIHLMPNQAWFAMLAYILVMLIIQAFLLNKRGQSIGKIVTKIKIVDQINESKVPLTRIFLIRSVFFIIFNMVSSPLMSIIDYAFGFGKNRQTLHDRLSKTKVIKESKK